MFSRKSISCHMFSLFHDFSCFDIFHIFIIFIFSICSSFDTFYIVVRRPMLTNMCCGTKRKSCGLSAPCSWRAMLLARRAEARRQHPERVRWCEHPERVLWCEHQEQVLWCEHPNMFGASTRVAWSPSNKNINIGRLTTI